MNTITPTLREDYVRRDGTALVYIVTHINRKPIKLSTSVNVKPSNWSKSRSRVKASDPDHDDKNLHIANCSARVVEIFKKYRLLFKQLSGNQLKNEYRVFSTHIDFYEFWEGEINKKRKLLADTTIIYHLSLLSKMKDFKKKLSFSEIDENLIRNYERYMRIARKNNKNTISKTLRVLKEYLTIARRLGKIEVDPFIYIKLPSQEVDIVALSAEELRELIYLYNIEEYQELKHKALGIFIFSCLTGLRISDIENLEYDDIRNDCLFIIPYKTRNQKSKHIEIPIIPLAFQIIDDNRNKFKDKKIFDGPHRATISNFLSDIAEERDMEKHISTKTGRHTFATLFLENGGSLEVLQKILGHSNIRETMIYVHVNTSRIHVEMKSFGTNFKI